MVPGWRTALGRSQPASLARLVRQPRPALGIFPPAFSAITYSTDNSKKKAETALVVHSQSYFSQFPGFKPNPRARFEAEFDRLAKFKGWKLKESKKKKKSKEKEKSKKEKDEKAKDEKAKDEKAKDGKRHQKDEKSRESQLRASASVEAEAKPAGPGEYELQRTIALREELQLHYFSQPAAEKPTKAAATAAAGGAGPGRGRKSGPGGNRNKSGPQARRASANEGESERPEPTPGQRRALKGYQNLCREVGITVGQTTSECKVLLKNTLTNIVDFVDVRRTGRGKVKVWPWADFPGFIEYTLGSKRNRVDPRGLNDVLRILLQRLRIDDWAVNWAIENEKSPGIEIRRRERARKAAGGRPEKTEV